MFFAKEMNLLSSRMAILAKAGALVDAICEIVPKTFYSIGDVEVKENHADNFDDMEFTWAIPNLDDFIENVREKMTSGEGFYESKVSLQVSQETERLAPVVESLNTRVKLFIYLTTVAFDKNEDQIHGDALYPQDIEIVVIIDNNGAHIDTKLSSVNISLNDFNDIIKDEPSISREQMDRFFNEVLTAIDAVNGDDRYMVRCNDKIFNKYGITFEEDGFFELDDSE